AQGPSIVCPESSASAFSTWNSTLMASIVSGLVLSTSPSPSALTVFPAVSAAWTSASEARCWSASSSLSLASISVPATIRMIVQPQHIGREARVAGRLRLGGRTAAHLHCRVAAGCQLRLYPRHKVGERRGPRVGIVAVVGTEHGGRVEADLQVSQSEGDGALT